MNGGKRDDSLATSHDVSDCAESPYPQVLVINGRAINSLSNLGITFSSLFEGWPLDRIAQVHMDDSDPSPEICRRFWRLSSDDVPLVNALRRIIKRNRKAILGGNATGLPRGSGLAASGQRRRLAELLTSAAYAWADILPYHVESNFWRWVEELKPDVVFSALGGVRIMDLVLKVAKRLQIPVVPFFCDDWPSTHYRNNVFSSVPRALLLRRIRDVMEQCPVGTGGSFSLAEEYGTRYGVPFEGFMACVETPEEFPTHPSLASDATVRIVYVGGLHLNRWQSIQEVGQASLKLRDEGVNVETTVYAPASDLAAYAKQLEMPPVLRIGGSLAAREVLPVMRNADILLHVESFDANVRQYTRLSLSTKIPQYMSTGRPILAYGPGEVASCRYIQESACGRVVGTADQSLMTAVLRDLATNVSMRADLGRCGWDVARKRHSKAVVHDHFRNVLLEASRAKPRHSANLV
jgi:glycosyltransferase involved in cell wall biosynthesis